MKLDIDEIFEYLNSYIEYVHRNEGKFYITLKNDKSFFKEIKKGEHIDFISYIIEKEKKGDYFEI